MNATWGFNFNMLRLTLPRGIWWLQRFFILRTGPRSSRRLPYTLLAYPKARRGGLRGAGRLSAESSITANISSNRQSKCRRAVLLRLTSGRPARRFVTDCLLTLRHDPAVARGIGARKHHDTDSGAVHHSRWQYSLVGYRLSCSGSGGDTVLR